MSKTFLFQAIHFSQTVQFSINMHLVLFNPLIGPLSGATMPGLSGPGSNDNEEVLRIPQSSSITGTSTSNSLVSYLGHVNLLFVCMGFRVIVLGFFYRSLSKHRVSLVLLLMQSHSQASNEYNKSDARSTLENSCDNFSKPQLKSPAVLIICGPVGRGCRIY